MTWTRRDFMATAGGIAAGAAFAPALSASELLGSAKRLRILILGGTGFLGPQIVRRAVANGHEITLFNRGQTGPELLPDLVHMKGDRYGDLTGLERAVEDGRTWDAVIDTFTYVPQTVTDAMDVLLPAMGQFVVISTTSVYAARSEAGMDESAPLAQVADGTAAGIKTHREVGAHYGAMKARVEKAAEGRMPGQVCVIRPGLIVGERDTTGRYSYWPIRGSEGGMMIGPGTGDDFVQFIDVRDLGDFTVHCIERGHMGVYNGISPPGERTMRDVVDAAIASSPRAETEAVWVDSEFLQTQGVAAWQHMPAWVPNSVPGYEGQGRLSTARSIAAGLKTRSLDDTNRAVLKYYRERQAELRAERGDEFGDQWRTQIRGGIPREKEADVLEQWAARSP
ncbi:MAG: NAD-dependent epimerase/dehydratase family protein [Planctomycetota bacterium]